MNTGLRARMLTASALLALIVGGAFAGLVVAISELRDSASLARHSEEVIAGSTQLEKLVVDLETGVRGYVITGQKRFLQPWETARAALPSEISRLERLVNDNPLQERRAQAIGRAIDSYVQEYSIPLVARAGQNNDRAREIVATGVGKRRVDALRSQFKTFVQTESALSAERRDRADADARRSIILGFGGLGASLVLIVLFVAYLTRAIVVPVRHLAGAARRVAGGELTARVESAGQGEVRSLVGDFNAMTDALAASRDELESQNAELEAQQVELEAQQVELEGQQAELEHAMTELGDEKERIEILYEFGRRLISEMDFNALTSTVMDAFLELTGADLGALYIAAAEDGHPFSLAATRAIEASRVPAELAAGDGAAGRAVQERRVVTLSYGQTRLKLPAFGEGVAVAQELHVPFVYGDRALGVLTMGRVDDRPFTPAEIAATEHLARQAGISLAKAFSLLAARREATINATILNATTDGIGLVGPDGYIVFANAAARRVAEVHGVSIEGNVQELAEQIADKTTDPRAYRKTIAESAANPDSETMREYTLADSGRSFVSHSSPVHDEEGVTMGRVFIIREVTAEREAERLKSELVATVSHELRTPLTGVLGFAELLLRQELDEETRRRYLTTIHNEARRLTGLINDFLDLQRMEEGSFSLKLEPFDLTELLRHSVELAGGQSAEHEIELSSPDEPLVVLGEAERIGQVVANLLSNAIKYSPVGGRITLDACAENGFARVSVTDPGLGIPLDQQPHIFEKFFRVDSSDTREIGGTGLGLAVCREIVQAHGGRIDFESAPDQGSTFWFELPIGSRQSNGKRGERVLVVEDDPAAAALLAEYLALDGFEVEVAPDGETALARAADDSFVLVCLDIQLSGEIDGWQVLTRLKAHPQTGRVPVVVCSVANGRDRAAALGASDFLAKPFSAEQLRAAIQRVLPERRGLVLVVDDEESVRRLVIETLSENGLRFREAADGEEALAAIEEARPDAVVLDLLMPKVDGFAVLERLQLDSKTRSIPVVVLTGRTLTEPERELLSAGAVALLRKSEYSARELRLLVGRALGR